MTMRLMAFPDSARKGSIAASTLVLAGKAGGVVAATTGESGCVDGDATMGIGPATGVARGSATAGAGATRAARNGRGIAGGVLGATSDSGVDTGVAGGSAAVVRGGRVAGWPTAAG
jgi:hypothetical protein